MMEKDIILEHLGEIYLLVYLLVFGAILILYSNYIDPYWYNSGIDYYAGYALSFLGGVFLIIITIWVAVKIIAKSMKNLSIW